MDRKYLGHISPKNKLLLWLKEREIKRQIKKIKEATVWSPSEVPSRPYKLPDMGPLLKTPEPLRELSPVKSPPPSKRDKTDLLLFLFFILLAISLCAVRGDVVLK